MAWPVWLLRLADGRIVVGCIFTFDSLTSQYQTKIYKRYNNISHRDTDCGSCESCVRSVRGTACLGEVYGRCQSGRPCEVGVVGLDQRLGASVEPLYHQTVWSFDLSVGHDDPQGALRRVLLHLVRAFRHSKKSDVYHLCLWSAYVPEGCFKDVERQEFEGEWR